MTDLEVQRTTRLFVGNIADMSERELRDIFQCYGCDRVIVVRDATGHPRGFGFVDVSDATKARLDLDRQMINGRRMHVTEARPETPR